MGFVGIVVTGLAISVLLEKQELFEAIFVGRFGPADRHSGICLPWLHCNGNLQRPVCPILRVSARNCCVLGRVGRVTGKVKGTDEKHLTQKIKMKIIRYGR